MSRRSLGARERHHKKAAAEFFVVSNILSKEYEVERAAAFTIAADEGAGVGEIRPA